MSESPTATPTVTETVTSTITLAPGPGEPVSIHGDQFTFLGIALVLLLFGVFAIFAAQLRRP